MKEGKKSYDFDVRRVDARFSGFDERVMASGMLPENKEAVLTFKRKVYAAGLMGKERLLKYEWFFKVLDRYLGKPFSDATREDLERILSEVRERTDWKSSVKADFPTMIKRYYKIVLGDPSGNEYPDLVKWIRVPKAEYPELNFEDCPTWGDVLMMGEYALNLRDKALILCIWEAGMRISEALTLRVGSLQEVEHGVYLNIQESKTKLRSVFVKLSAPALLNWLSVHPLRDDKEAPLFCRMAKEHYTKAVGYRYSYKLLKRLKQKAGIKKTVRPHMLRHGSASYFSDILSDSDMDMKYGWAFGSPHKKRYQHKQKRGVEAKILRMSGIDDDVGVKNIFEEQGDECYYCHAKNTKGAKVCYRCKRLLDLNVADKVQKLKDNLDDVSVVYLQQNPKVLKGFLDYLSTHGSAGD